MSPRSLHGNGKSLKKKPRNQNQQNVGQREHNQKYPRDTDDVSNDTRSAQNLKPPADKTKK